MAAHARKGPEYPFPDLFCDAHSLRSFLAQSWVGPCDGWDV